MQQPSRQVATCVICKALAALIVAAGLPYFLYFVTLKWLVQAGLTGTTTAYYDTIAAGQGCHTARAELPQGRAGQGRAGQGRAGQGDIVCPAE